MGKIAIALLHGYNSTKWYMKGIQRELESWGKVDQVVNLSLYDAGWGMLPGKYHMSTPIVHLEPNNVRIEGSLVEYVLDQLEDKLDPDITDIILLGHSMGGLVWRALLKSHIMPNPNTWLRNPSPQVKALIQLATPNQGSRLTNMGLIKAIDRVQSTIVLKVLGAPVNWLRRLATKLGAAESQPKSDEEELPTQIEQMRPNSDFLNWLNSDPTYVDLIPHYRVIGQRNSIIFTNLAWVDSPDEYDLSELVEDYDIDLETTDINEILDLIYADNKQISDEEIQNIAKQLEADLDDETVSNQSFQDRVRSMFDSSSYTPNDGLVSIEDAKLPGSIEISLDEYSEKISHWSIAMWFLPFKPHRYVRDRVLAVLDEEIREIKD